jgi:hypothetical protein
MGLAQFVLDYVEEDNLSPTSRLGTSWRPVATDPIGLECQCKAEEPTIVEDKGDFGWRP